MDFGKAEEKDRISELPDTLIHHILSFIHSIKCVARTCILSKRWKYIWTSIPTLVFPPFSPEPSQSEIDKFMGFVDSTLFLHDISSSIRKFHLMTNNYMCPLRVHSWIEYLTSRNVQDLQLYFDQDKPFHIPSSLFKCDSLIKLELATKDCPIHLPKSLSFPKLKKLKLIGIRFTDDCSWNEQHFSECPVLEKLTLEECTWLGARNFCISIPALKVLEFHSTWEDDGLPDCALKINAPNLVSLAYSGCVAKEYVFSSFQTLESAQLHLICQDGVPRKQNMGYGAAVSKFIRTISRVQSLVMHAETLEVLSIVNILPTFHDLDELILGQGETTDKSLFSLFKAVPKLRSLIFEESCIDNNNEKEPSWASHMLTAGCMFQLLQSVVIVRFTGNARQLRWVKLILEKAKALEEVILSIRSDDEINKEKLMRMLQSLPKASDICKFEIEEY